MGEYVENREVDFTTAEAKIILAQLLGCDVEELKGIMIVGYLSRHELSEDEDDGNFIFTGNIADSHIEDFLITAVAHMKYAMRNQEIADSVPDDISGLEGS